MKAHHGIIKKWIGHLACVLMGACLILAAALARADDSSCLKLSDIPLDTQEQAAPGLIMFLIDDSGSMDWTVMCDPNEQTDGVFNGYEYVFSDPGDDAYRNLYSSYDDHIEDSNSHKMEWMSQWSGYNRLYYDPSSTYTPWPTLPDADPDNPRSNPVNSSPTFNMNATYYAFGQTDTGMTTDDIQAVDGSVIVDDAEGQESQEAYDEVIDDSGGNASFYVNNGSYWTRSTETGYNGDYRWYTTEQDCQWVWVGHGWNRHREYQCDYPPTPAIATYQFDLPATDTYEVFVTWGQNMDHQSEYTHAAEYDIHTASGVVTQTVDQSTGGGDWVSLGQYTFNAGNATIELTFNGCGSPCRVCADAVRMVRIVTPAPQPDKWFECTGPWNISSSSECYPAPGNTGYYHYTAYYGYDYTATWTATNLDPATEYDVYIRYLDSSSLDTSVNFTIKDDTTVLQSVNVNQETNGGPNWYKLSTDPCTFASGTGVVYLQHHVYGYYDLACADAVAFVPKQVQQDLNINDILRPHYYVRNSNGTFLVNLNGTSAASGTIEYYSVNLTDPDDDTESVTYNKLTRLTDQQAADDGIVTGRTYAQERRNFANWYSFYRRREFTAKNAIARVVNTMTGVYIGFLSINGELRQCVLPVKVTLDGTLHDQTTDLLDALYAYRSPPEGTPLRQGLQHVGEYYEGNYSTLNPSSYSETDPYSNTTYPYFKADKGGECQQAFCIVMTDGYWNGSSPGVGNVDQNEGYPYSDSVSNTLADVAAYYYNNDLQPDLGDHVPVNNTDTNNKQHMVTYSLSFGVSGTLDLATYGDCPTGACPTSWPDPTTSDSTPKKIDDLFHAAVNGHGKYINASSPLELVNALDELKQDIEIRLGSAAALATNSLQLQVGTMVYQGTYNTANWFGEVSAMPVNLTTGAVGDPVWRAGTYLNSLTNGDLANRLILSYNGSAGIEFTPDQITSTQSAQLATNNLGTDAATIVNFIRGDTSHDTAHGGVLRHRANRLGDIVHSAPVYFKGVVYIGANDGMLHAFNADTGQEMFAYVPNLVYSHLADLASPGYSHEYYVDNTPYAADTKSQDLLVDGLGKGGKGYFCLDISDPEHMNTGDVLWEYPSSGTDDDMGYSYSQAFIVHCASSDHPWVVIFGNGYDSVNGHAVLYVLDAVHGSVLNKIDTHVGNCNGLATPAVIDVEFDGNVDYAYAGDLKGNMWKFDLTADDPADWKVAYEDAAGNPEPLITVGNAQGQVQPITAAPDVRTACTSAGGYLVIFGTGKYLEENDFGDDTTQTFYGIWDWEDLWTAKNGADVAKQMYLGQFTAARTLSNISGNAYLSDLGRQATLLQQTVVADVSGWRTLTDNVIDYYNPLGDTGSHLGWYFDLPDTGERCIREPTLRKGVAIMISTIPSSSPCESGGSSFIYQLASCSGGRTATPQFDTNSDYTVNANDLINGLPPTAMRLDQVVFEPVELGKQLYLPNAQGDINTVTVSPDPPGMTYWRIIE